MRNIAILTLNPCIDRCVYLGKPLTPGTIHRATEVRQDVAGKGLNQALVLRNLGENVEYFSFGAHGADDASDRFIRAQGITYRKTGAACGIRTNLKIVDAIGVGTEINERGGPITQEELSALLEQLSRSRAEVLSVCGSIPAGVDSGIYRDVIATAREQGKITVLDADGEALSRGMEARPHYIKPNRRELAGLCGLDEQALSDETLLLAQCVALHRRYGTNILCTLDEQGSLYVGAQGVLRVGVARYPLRGFSGAGDTYLAAFLWSHLQMEQPIEMALAYAARASAAKIALDGTALPTKAQIDAVGEVEVRRLG